MRKMLRDMIVATALGAAIAPLAAALLLPALAQNGPSTIAIDNFTFNPQRLTVKAGATVTWTNKDDIPHAIASPNNAFSKSKALDTDNSYSFTFTAPGTYQYFCYLHPRMTGTIVVEAAPGNGPTQ